MSEPLSVDPVLAEAVTGGHLTAYMEVMQPGWLQHVPDLPALSTKVLAAVCDLVHVPVGDLSFIFLDDAAVRALNRTYRNQDKPTNVLSFAAQEASEDADGDFMIAPADPVVVYGDVVLALQTMMVEAEAQKKSLHDHTAHLMTHGVLHLLGYDHINASEAEEMEQLERDILDKLAIPDPYRDQDTAGGPMKNGAA